MMNNLKGIGMFCLQILSVISAGYSESIESIEEHMNDSDLVEYLSKKYDNQFVVKYDDSIYSNEAINGYFSGYTGYIQGNENRKYGIQNEDDGLLLILALLMDQVEMSSVKWEI